MKKTIALLLATLMLLFTLPAMADAEVLEYRDCGITFTMPEAIHNSEYVQDISSYGILNHDPTVAILSLDYYAVRYDQYEVFEDAAEAAMSSGLYTESADIVVTDAESLEAALAILGGSLDGTETVTEFGTANGFHYYLVRSDVEDFLSVFDEIGETEAEKAEAQAEKEKVRADIGAVCDGLLESLQAAELYAPEDSGESVIGKTISFTSVDLDGNPVDIADLFKNNRITLVNFWGYWCPHCVDEMAELAEMHTRLQEKGCGIVGVEWEKAPIAEVEADVRALMDECGTNYPNVLIPEDTADFEFVEGFPCTVFVDSEGKVLTYPIIGARPNSYESTLDALLAGEGPEAGAEADAEAGAVENGAGAYRVFVSDSEGPVEGVVVQLCDDETCAFQKTDAQGIATFRPESQKVYDVHILTVPEGYAAQDAAYKTLETWSDVSILIEKAA